MIPNDAECICAHVQWVWCARVQLQDLNSDSPAVRCVAADGSQVILADTAFQQRQLPYPWLHPMPGASPYPKMSQCVGHKV